MSGTTRQKSVRDAVTLLMNTVLQPKPLFKCWSREWNSSLMLNISSRSQIVLISSTSHTKISDDDGTFRAESLSIVDNCRTL